MKYKKNTYHCDKNKIKKISTFSFHEVDNEKKYEIFNKLINYLMFNNHLMNRKLLKNLDIPIKTIKDNDDFADYLCVTVHSAINPLSANPTKWSNTLKQFVSFC